MSEVPLSGLTVVEHAVGVSDLGLGLAGGVPGMLLADLGATVVRVQGSDPAPIDAQVHWGRVWHRDKRVVRTDDPAEIATLLRTADVALMYGTEAMVEARGLGYADAHAANPGLVYARCRPSRNSTGAVDDYSLLVEARSGFCTQLDGHRPGPIFVDVRASGIGTAALLTTSVLALLRRRALTGAGGWAETSLYDGMLATLGCMIGRSERAAPEIESYWEKGSTFPNFLYRCADGELIQVWFGGKGMYAKLIDVLGDEPSRNGYYSDQMTGKLGERAARWVSFFSAQPRDVWIERLRAAGVACEPVFGPGDALGEAHMREIGLAITRTDQGHEDVMVGSPITVRARPVPAGAPEPPEPSDPAGRAGGTGLLAGVRVVDFSAFVAGPLAAEVLADLGADVIKIEPPEGEAMRAAAYAVAACQRGKRSVAMDLTAPEVRPIVVRLLEQADVVLHNFRVGVAERLGIGEQDVAAINPRAVYCHASAFGSSGPRATFPGNDALMQAVTGLERALGGAGNDPIAATWIPIDMAGGWVAATGILAALYGRTTTGAGQWVGTNLLGAGMLMHSGAFERDGELLRCPELDRAQTGYGPGYRLYTGSDGAWFAVVVPDAAAWQRLRELPGADALPADYVPLRASSDDEPAQAAETVLEAVFASAPAADWIARLPALGVQAELIAPLNRDAFRRAVLDDPRNRELRRVVGYHTADWGWFEQLGPLHRFGPASGTAPRLMLPRVGEHSVEVLTELGFTDDEIDALLVAKVVRQLGN